MAKQAHGNHRDVVVDVVKPWSFAGGLEFTGLTYSVTKKQKVDGAWASQEVDLLHYISGYAPRGSVTAVMGPSGAGKSTFLDALAGRIASGSLRGRVAFDGVEMSPGLVKRTSAYVMQDDRLFPMLTVFETLMFAADFRLGPISRSDKKLRVESLIEQLGLTSARNTYIGDAGTRGVSGGERRRVSIGVDIIHGPPLLFLDEPTSGLDSTSAHSVVEKIYQIARAGSTVILTIHQPSYRIQRLLDHLIVLARGQLVFFGSPKDVGHHLTRMGRRGVPKGENSLEYLLDVIQEYDQSEIGVGALADFCLTGLKPPKTTPSNNEDMRYSSSAVSTPQHRVNGGGAASDLSEDDWSGNRRVRLSAVPRVDDFDRSIRSPWSSAKSPWSGTHSGIMDRLRFTPSRTRRDHRPADRSLQSMSPGYYRYSVDMLSATPTPQGSECTVNEDNYKSPRSGHQAAAAVPHPAGPKFRNSYLGEVWVLTRRNFNNIRRTPELFLSRQMVLTVMAFMMATLFFKPRDDAQGVANRLSFIIFTVCLFFFSSNDAVPSFIQERLIFERETSHDAYRASAYVLSGILTNLPFLAIQAATYAAIVWVPLRLRGDPGYLFLALYASLVSTNSFVVFVSVVVPNIIMGFAAVIAFTALFFLFCGYFLEAHSIPAGWKWMNVISTMKYPYEGLLMNQFQTRHVFGMDLTGNPITGFGILEQMGISTEVDRKWWMVGFLLAWAVFYRVLFYLVLRFASKNQRT
ncbi:hypothetical protein Taro_016387 [Colocasia esculenta]|uniref:ABC transporter G family member STR2 n=1 Tax=Colocasia esculenta TaxID=4460 RepID=A0A843UST2_COLES|nr:hypothetical protein [Colocasia esculenta]